MRSENLQIMIVLLLTSHFYNLLLTFHFYNYEY